MVLPESAERAAATGHDRDAAIETPEHLRELNVYVASADAQAVRRHGHIINIASVLGFKVLTPGGTV